MDKIGLFDIKIDNLSLPEALAKISSLADSKKFHFVALPNAQHIVLLDKDLDFKKAYLSADLALADGMSIVMLSKMIKKPLKERIAGYDLLFALFGLAAKKNYSFFLLKGGEKKALDAIVAALKRLFCGIDIAGFYAPALDFDFCKERGENEKILRLINKARPDILIIGLGAPKQEKWIYHNRSALAAVPVCMAAGGALDVITGRLKKPPEFIRNCGLEWFFRFCQEPRRLWKRCLFGNAAFLCLAVREALFGND